MADQSTVYTLDEALSFIGFGKCQGLALAYAGLGWLAEAMELMLLSFVGQVVRSEWKLSSGEESLLTTVVFAGMLVGAYIWGLIADTYGRTKSFLGVAIVTAGAGFISAFSPNYKWLLGLRCIVGFGLGGGHVYSSWFLEFVPTPNRGTWMVVFITFWTIGTIFEAALAWIVMPSLGWRWLLVLSSLPAFTLLVFYPFIFETPRYLCVRGRISEAHAVLEKVAMLNKTKLPAGMLVSDEMSEVDEEFAASENTHLLTPLKKISDSVKGSASPLVLFSSNLIRTTCLLWFAYFGNTFSYYGVILLTSELSSGQSKCSSTSFLSHNNQDSSLYLDTFITALAELPGLVLSAIILDKIGRKLSMAILLLSGIVCLLPLVSHQNEIVTTALLFGTRMFVSASFTCTCIYAPEVYPTSIRSTGVGIATAIGRLGGMICPLVAVALVTDCHQTAAVFLFECVLVFTGFCVLLFPFETKGKDLIDSVGVFPSK